jgi:osmoprotectant transport system ATP-binding protein
MIRLEGVTKLFPNATRPAVAGIDLAVAAGETCVLIGPSGCGKTTTLRMINRLIEPTGGRIIVENEDVTEADPVQLRRRIGYVIQSVGLFPHLTVAANIATVPRLLGWPKARIEARVRELLDLVGLDPAQFGERRPASLSGGQKQRIGVARALAADPPVLLMDEPFGAVDPVVRGRLQAEVLAILKRLNKTVILVTHDIDEAIRMGGRVAVMQDGRIVQCDTPDRLLLAPANAFVEDFVGVDRALRRLSLIPIGDIADPGAAPAGSATLAAETSIRTALSVMLESGADVIGVKHADRPAGSLSLAAIRAFSRQRA